MPETIVKAALVVPGDYVVDGECVGEKLFVFDLLELDGQDQRGIRYYDRLTALLNLMPE